MEIKKNLLVLESKLHNGDFFFVFLQDRLYFKTKKGSETSNSIFYEWKHPKKYLSRDGNTTYHENGKKGPSPKPEHHLLRRLATTISLIRPFNIVLVVQVLP